MKREREISVRIFTERSGFPMPFFGMFGDAPGEDLTEPANLSVDELSGEPEDEEPVMEGEMPEGEPFPAEDTTLSREWEEPEKSEFFAMGKLVETDDRLEILYEESVLTGMEGSVTGISFSKAEPNIVSMVRRGLVDVTLVFEEGKRHITIYQTPFAEFELCVCALSVQNLLLREGVINLDYITELHGARTERCKMQITIG